VKIVQFSANKLLYLRNRERGVMILQWCTVSKSTWDRTMVCIDRVFCQATWWPWM